MRVGIDLGTTYSLIARLNTSGVPVLLPDRHTKKDFPTPSRVAITTHGAFIGAPVETLQSHNPDLKVLQFFKRHFGEDKPLFFDAQGQEWFPETLAALVLKKLKVDAEAATSIDVKSAVITVPAHFNDRQRKAVLVAAALADLPVQGLVEEPVAAALHYGVKSGSRDQLLVVYDLGGGTFDVTVLTLNNEGLHVLGKDGLTDLGGKEFDEKIAALILEQFTQALGAEPPLTAQSLLQLHSTAEELKIELCLPGGDMVRRLVLLGTEALEVQLSRRDFEAAILDEVKQTEVVTRRCLSSAGLTPEDVDAILLVGGSSMVPLIRTRLRQLFIQPAQQILFHEPTRAVAFGAALHTCQLSGEAHQFDLPPVIRGVTGYHVGVRAKDPQTDRVIIDTLIKKNMRLPATVRKIYYTTRPDQRLIVLDIVQYLDTPADAVSLGQLVIGPLSTPQQNHPVEVEIRSLEDGTLAVEAYDPQTRQKHTKTFGHDSQEGLAHLARQRALVQAIALNREFT